MTMQLDHEQLHRLLDALGESDIQEFRLEGDDFRLEIRRNLPVQSVVASAPVAAVPVVATEPASAPPAATATRGDLLEVTAPMVGTYYRAPSPDDAPFVEVGSRINVGQTVCILEAMKLMNELESEVSGEVVEILVDNCPEEQLDSLEIALIAEHDTRYPTGYNLTDGGDVNPAKEGDGHAKLMAMHESGEIKAAQRIGWAKPGVREKASASHKKRCREDGGRQARQGAANLVTGDATKASHSEAAIAKRQATWDAKRKEKLSKLPPYEAARVIAQSKRKKTSYAKACVAAGGAEALREKRREWARLRQERGGR